MSLVQGRPRFTLRPSNLSDSEAATIAAFLRVGSHRFLGDWRMVLDGPCHVLVRAQLGAEQASPAPPAAAAAILHVHDKPGSARTDALVRPLQYDAFVEALLDVERKLMRQAVGRLPAARAGTGVPAESSAQRRAVLTIPPGARLRLRRWPSAALLQAHRYNLRLASFLSARPMNLDELIRSSNVTRSQCEQFLVALSDAGILDVEAGTKRLPPAPQAASRSDMPRGTHSERGLIDHVRRRLGLGRSG